VSIRVFVSLPLVMESVMDVAWRVESPMYLASCTIQPSMSMPKYVEASCFGSHSLGAVLLQIASIS